MTNSVTGYRIEAIKASEYDQNKSIKIMDIEELKDSQKKLLTENNIKTTKAAIIGPRSILSSEQVYDYVAREPREGSPVMRFLDEAELELKCLAFVDVKIPAAAAAMARHSKEHNIDAGSGIQLP